MLLIKEKWFCLPVIDDCPVRSSTAMARRLQALQDGVCLPAHWTGALPAWKVGASLLQLHRFRQRGRQFTKIHRVATSQPHWLPYWVRVVNLESAGFAVSAVLTVVVCVCVCALQDAGGADLPGSRLRDERHPAEERRETRHGPVCYRRLQEEVPQCE